MLTLLLSPHLIHHILPGSSRKLEALGLSVRPLIFINLPHRLVGLNFNTLPGNSWLSAPTQKRVLKPESSSVSTVLWLAKEALVMRLVGLPSLLNHTFLWRNDRLEVGKLLGEQLLPVSQALQEVRSVVKVESTGRTVKNHFFSLKNHFRFKMAPSFLCLSDWITETKPCGLTPFPPRHVVDLTDLTDHLCTSRHRWKL
ncbi:hypothetical protein EYF80_016189 [Liparis tanakae]|uniref:Uncharacterized protein n=1 Tax=Liparis tanakae TaxID=230148 RepID=A0A4Z2I8B3_9TELE|nr:hypothetical protein EYF80_016189 [Liparis tanakae]